MMQDRIISAIYKAVDEDNKVSPPESQLRKSMDESIMGPASSLDSLAVVRFVSTVEKMLENEFGKRINLSAKALSAKDFRALVINIEKAVGGIVDK